MESYLGKAPCPCGKAHEATIDEVLVAAALWHIFRSLCAGIMQRSLLKVICISEQPAALGNDREVMCLIFQATKDIWDKYVFSLAWDLGLTDDV